ncbi:MAG: dependent ligase, partial [Bryobacterales bacterium]|nr:dependent ligase [Bryobacterales bacterium]
MSLNEYVRKRSFAATPEPKPAVKRTSAAGQSFCVQRHDATRLHYDFRLEIDGTLKSWAIPKGPTLDPTPKRLAAMVEDHPLEYGGFEGNIPAGNYGAGSVMLWDRGTYELLGDKPALDQLARGDLKFRLDGEKLKGEFAIVLMKGRGKGNEWLLLKKKDAEARPGWDVEQYAYSVATGRTQEEIAKEMPPREAPKKSRKKKEATPTKVRHSSGDVTDNEGIDVASLPGAVRAPMPEAIVPMKALLTDTPPKGDEWLFEIKWDGVRAICFIDDKIVRMSSRTGNSCERQYPELSVIGHQISARQAILDGEIAVLDKSGVSRFSLIQSRIGVADPNSIAHLARRTPATLFVFDLLYLDGYDLRGVRLAERKRALASIAQPSAVMRVSEHFVNNGEEMLNAARATGLEGIIAKCATSTYQPKRSRDWLKIKIVAQQEFILCGYTAGEREHFGSLVLGLYQDGELVYVGNVGTGFDQRLLDTIYQRIEPLTTARSPFKNAPRIARDVTWVRPEVVCAVKFSNWTEDGMLRAPVFLGLRPDVDPKECVRETTAPVEETAKAGARPLLLSGKADEVSMTIDNRRLKFTHLNKIFYPAEGYNKRDLLNYYDAVADLLLPYLKDRPLSLKRYPDGITADFFFQKDTHDRFPDWMRVEPIYSDHKKAPTRWVLADDRATLLYLTNLGCIDQNPWMSRVGALECPDFMLIDLDPQGCEFERIIEAAQLVRKKLDLLGLEGYPKTTGGDGMHIYVPLEPLYNYDQVRSFTEIIARVVATERPDLFTTPRPVARREQGKVYFDYLQIGASKTIAAPYVVRAYPGAPVATPLAWREVTPGLMPSHFHIRNVLDRFSR